MVKEWEEWKVITHLVYCGFTNIDGVEWGLEFSRYTDDTRKGVQGGSIGYINPNGNIEVRDPRKHKVIFQKASGDREWLKGMAGIIWLERSEQKESKSQ